MLNLVLFIAEGHDNSKSQTGIGYKITGDDTWKENFALFKILKIKT